MHIPAMDFKKPPALLALTLAASALTGATPIDITFYQVGDTHYEAFDANPDHFNITNRSNLQKMMAMTPATTMPGAGTLGLPVGVIACGDLLNGYAETDPDTGTYLDKTASMQRQWENFTKDFGLLGTETDSILKYPVFEGYGNHDQDGFLKQESDYIAARAAQHPNKTGQSGLYTYVGGYGNISVTGVHYAWKWGPVHFVQANMRIGDGPQRYPCSGSYTFLKNYLENTVGDSGDPVFVAVHLPPNTAGETEWPVADRQAFYDLIKSYNTVGILVGHVHSYAYSLWKGPDGTGSLEIPVYQCDSMNHSGDTQGICSAFRIVGDPLDSTKATVYVAQRLRNNTWGVNSSRTISLPAAEPPPVSNLAVNQWKSINLHNNIPCGLAIADNTFVEPRQAGVRQVEVLFSEAIAVPNLAAAITITGVNNSGAVSPASLGLTTHAAISPAGNSLVVTFEDGGGARALPDAAKWRFTLNPAAITGTGTNPAVLSASANTTRVITGLIGDFNGNGRTTGVDLNLIANTTTFDPANDACLRADIDGDAQIGIGDLNIAWANRAQRTDSLATP